MDALTINNIYDQMDRTFGKITYGFEYPITCLVLIPVIAQVVQEIQLYSIGEPDQELTVKDYLGKVNPINSFHAMGGLIRSIVWIAAAFFTNNTIFTVCAAIALSQSIISIGRLVRDYDPI